MSTDAVYPTLPELVSDSGVKVTKKTKKGKKEVVAKKKAVTDGTASQAPPAAPEALMPVGKPRSKDKGKGKGKAATVEDTAEDEGHIEMINPDESSPDDWSDTSGSSDSEAPHDEDPKTRAARKKVKRAAKAQEDAKGRKARRKATRKRREAKDKQQRAEINNEGIANYIERRRNRRPPFPRPPEIEKYWKELYPLVKQWWAMGGKEIPDSHKPGIARVQKMIKQYCSRETKKIKEIQEAAYKEYLKKRPSLFKRLKKENPKADSEELFVKQNEADRALRKETGVMNDGEMAQQYAFPVDFLHDQITSLGKKLASRSLTKELQTDFLHGAIVFMDALYDYGIAPVDVTSSEAMTKFQKFALSSKDNQQELIRLKEELERPAFEQVEVWDAAALPMYRLLEFVADEDAMQTPEAVSKVEKLVRTIGKHNAVIQQTNKRIGFREDANIIPLALLSELKTRWEQADHKEVTKTKERLLNHLRSQESARSILKAIESGKVPRRLTSSSEGSGDKDKRVNPQSSQAAPSNQTNEELSPRPAPKSRGKRQIVDPGVNPEDLLNFDLDSTGLGDDFIEIYRYEDGRTEFGALVATRACRTDNPRFSRFIVNSGLEEDGYEFFRVIKGNDLAPGGADKLDDQKVVEFDLRRRRKQIKEHPLDVVGPCVLMSRSDDYEPRGTKERQPDTYIRVTYRGDPEAEWLTRTEFIQLAGKKFADRKFASLIPAFKKRQLYFEACKVQRRHPRTKEPLTFADLSATPWLFSEDDLMNWESLGLDMKGFDGNEDDAGAGDQEMYGAEDTEEEGSEESEEEGSEESEEEDAEESEEEGAEESDEDGAEDATQDGAEDATQDGAKDATQDGAKDATRAVSDDGTTTTSEL